MRSLTPVPFTEEALETCARNIRRVQAELGLPFIIENIAWLFDTPLSTLDEADFLAARGEGGGLRPAAGSAQRPLPTR